MLVAGQQKEPILHSIQQVLGSYPEGNGAVSGTEC